MNFEFKGQTADGLAPSSLVSNVRDASKQAGLDAKEQGGCDPERGTRAKGERTRHQEPCRLEERCLGLEAGKEQGRTVSLLNLSSNFP